MIGVLANESDHSVVAEFFELFKTPWEFYRVGVRYDVLMCSNRSAPDNSAKLVLIYGSLPSSFDQTHGIKTGSLGPNRILASGGDRIPIYGKCLAFQTGGVPVLLDERTKEPVMVELASEKQAFVRIGFDLFHEIRYLIGCGQPVENAGIPALELHIELLRDLIVSRFIPLVEIPPIPIGHNFTTCLTHDVDHAGIKNHKFDHTMFGFLYRALVGSVVNLCRGRRSLRQVAINWKAAFSLPLVFAGLAKDFWDQLDGYVDLERDLGSTFFVIPTRGHAGVNPDGRTRSKRASRYALSDIAAGLRKLLSANREVAVHGVDAWRDVEKGREERERIEEITGTNKTGVRMHWLYFDSQAPLALEKAGYAYDSTIGYNDTVGYRAGTNQVFKPLTATRLLELPMHVMDTALFFPERMNLSLKESGGVLNRFVENASRFGGALTINWHDRSIAPERLWEAPYVELLNNLKSNGTWFATAGEAVSWFKKRRSATIDNVLRDGDSVRVRVSMSEINGGVPGLRLRLHCSRSNHIEVPITDSTEIEFPTSH